MNFFCPGGLFWMWSQVGHEFLTEIMARVLQDIKSWWNWSCLLQGFLWFQHLWICQPFLALWGACWELNWCRHFPGLQLLSVLPCRAAGGSWAVEGGSAIPLQELLLFCTGILHPAGKEETMVYVSFLRSVLLLLGKPWFACICKVLVSQTCSHSCNYQQPWYGPILLSLA